MQGMNELVGTLYYAFVKNELSNNADPSAEEVSRELEDAEADTFFCFTILMSELQDFFINTLDNSSCGLQGLIERFSISCAHMTRTFFISSPPRWVFITKFNHI